MSNIAMQGGATGTGTVTLLAPVTSTDRTLTLPDATGTVVSTASTAVVTPAMLTQPFTSGTAVASTSGTSIDFTSIPSWVKRITVMLSGVSLSGTTNLLVQIGSGSVSTSGYISTSNYTVNAGATIATSATNGFVIFLSNSGAILTGHLPITLLGSNTYVGSHVASYSATQSLYGAGNVTLSGALDRVRITTVNGTDTFDAGSINILYEG